MMFQNIFIVACLLNVAVSLPFNNSIQWTWVTHSDLLMSSLEPVGIENKALPLFLCRVNYEGNNVPGKLSVSSDTFSCKVPYKGREYSSLKFQILQTFPGTTSWKQWTPSLEVKENNMVSSGIVDGEISYVCRSKLGKDLIPGRLSLIRRSCFMAKDGDQHERTEPIEVMERNAFGSYMNTTLP